MKGYVVLAVVVSLILLSFPPLMLRGTKEAAPAQAVVSDTVTVRHHDSNGVSDISLRDMTVYETAAQISFDAPVEAIKAQAVSCYTLLRYQQKVGECVESTALAYPSAYTESYWKEHFGEQYEQAMKVYREAVDSVYGTYIAFDGQPIMALSHTMNGGMTENGQVLLGQELPYLQSVASAADPADPAQLQTVTVSLAEAKQAVTAWLGTSPSEDVTTWLQNPERTEAGTVKSVSVCEKSVSGIQIQERFSLPSASFEMDIQGEQVIFTVHGKGHFVGLSTTGAIAMAKDGHSFKDILQHYYIGITII